MEDPLSCHFKNVLFKSQHIKYVPRHFELYLILKIISGMEKLILKKVIVSSNMRFEMPNK